MRDQGRAPLGGRLGLPAVCGRSIRRKKNQPIPRPSKRTRKTPPTINTTLCPPALLPSPLDPVGVDVAGVDPVAGAAVAVLFTSGVCVASVTVAVGVQAASALNVARSLVNNAPNWCILALNRITPVLVGVVVTSPVDGVSVGVGAGGSVGVGVGGAAVGFAVGVVPLVGVAVGVF